jgi:CheY-like chemotaxis protein
MQGEAAGQTRVHRILVVDDEEAIRRLAAACIKHALGEDYVVLEAASGEEGVETAKRERPDLILLDVVMPGINGFEACRRLKDSEATRDIPIIFLTVRGETKDVERGLALGADGYMLKPFNAVTLAAQIADLLTPHKPAE